MQYSQSSTPVVIPPHNFVLEIALAYGVVGLALWLLVFCFPLMQRAVRRHLLTAPGVLTALALGYALCTALFQPLMLNPTVLLFATSQSACWWPPRTQLDRPGPT